MESYRDQTTGRYHFTRSDVEQMYIMMPARRAGFLDDLAAMIAAGKAEVIDA